MNITKSIYLNSMLISTWIFVHVCYPISNVFRLNCKNIAASELQRKTYTEQTQAHVNMRFKPPTATTVLTNAIPLQMCNIFKSRDSNAVKIFFSLFASVFECVCVVFILRLFVI